MKKMFIVLIFVVGTIGMGLYFAIKTGEKSPFYSQGQLVLDAQLEPSAGDFETLFMIIYDLDSPMPMPFGAVKFRLDKAPRKGAFFDFSITKEKLMVMREGEIPPPKRMRIKARLDKDGVAGPDQPGDITGEVSEISFGQSGVSIVMDKLIPAY